jgi:type IV secretory pathway TrbF-like protein
MNREKCEAASNERLRNGSDSARASTAGGMMAITLVLAFGMVWVSTRSSFVPYVEALFYQGSSGNS